MKNKKLNLLKSKYNLKLLNKNINFEKKINKSIIQNNEIGGIIKTIVFKELITKFKLKKNLCLESGRYRGLITQFNQSRHTVKHDLKKNILSNWTTKI